MLSWRFSFIQKKSSEFQAYVLQYYHILYFWQIDLIAFTAAHCRRDADTPNIKSREPAGSISTQIRGFLLPNAN